jgi:hypothetical protein
MIRMASVRCVCGLFSLGLATAQGFAADAVSGAPDVSARAEVAAADLAESLRSVESTLRSAGPVGPRKGSLTEEENARVIEAAMKEHLAQMTVQLELLSNALAAGQDVEAKAMLDSLRWRVAEVSQLGQRTDQLMIPPDQLQALRELWKDIEAFPMDGAVGALAIEPVE